MSRPNIFVEIAIGVVPFACLFVALFAGRYGITPAEVVLALCQGACYAVGFLMSVFGAAQSAIPDLGLTPEVYTLVIEVRLPRAICAAVVGGALAASGAAFQGVFRNPLVNPGLLGVSNGAGFGAALAIVIFGGGIMVYPNAFIFGIIAVLLSYWIARVYKQAPTIMLILGGTIVSSVFSALVSLMKYVADPENQLPSIVYWLMGSLSQAGWAQLWALIPIAAGVAILMACAWRIDILSMGDKEARSLGIEVTRDKGIIVAGATMATAGAVCISGVVGWVGLIIPHVGRMLIGSDNRRLIPASAALGAAFLIVVDTVSRCVWASEVPLGILTALIGAPFFVYLLKKTKASVWS